MPKIYVAGHRGMVGSAIIRQLSQHTNTELVVRSREELDLMDQLAVRDFFFEEGFDQVYLAAAKVGGIYANNTYPADFIYQNLTIQNNIIDSAYRSGVDRLLFLGSSCIYPKLAEQPMSESALLSGGLESTNEPYAIAKIAGIKMCESYNRQYGTDFRAVMPTNLYGMNDNFHPKNSHVIPALINRFHAAKVAKDDAVTVWGSGNVRREFLNVEDMAKACVFVMNRSQEELDKIVHPTLSHLNIGTGEDVTIAELAQTIACVVGYKGLIKFDSTKPDGAPRKLLDVEKINKFGWYSQISLEEGLVDTYRWFCENILQIRA